MDGNEGLKPVVTVGIEPGNLGYGLDPAGKAAAGKASAVSPAAGTKGAKPDPKSGAKPSARSAIRSDSKPGGTKNAKPGSKPGLGARAEKPKSRADKLPFQRSKALPGLPD